MLPKLKYRGDLRDFEAWEKLVRGIAHALDIPVPTIEPTVEMQARVCISIVAFLSVFLKV